MLKKAKENSELIDFGLTSESPELIKLADGLFEELGVIKKHVPRKIQILVTLIVNLVYNYTRGFYTAIPRGKNFYSNIVPRYKSKNMSPEIIVDLIDRMRRENKYVEVHFKGTKNEFTEASQYYPSKLLITLARGPLTGSIAFLNEECILLRKRVPKNSAVTLTPQNPAAPLTLEESLTSGLQDEGLLTRNYKKILVDYTDTNYTRGIRQDLQKYNQWRLQNSISLKDLPATMFNSDKYYENIRLFAEVDTSGLQPDTRGNYQVPLTPDRLVRIFTQDFEHGGRFYRGVETQLKKELRPYLAINGERTIELDYSSYHIRMLYHLDKKRSPEDPYMVFPGLDDNEGRDYYKIMVAACLNNDNEQSVLRTMRHYIIKKKLTDAFAGLTDVKLKAGLALLVKHNRPVAAHFFQGNGLKYHRIDSDIANDILMHFTRLRHPVLVLCVHDSFIIAEKHGNALLRAMNKFYKVRVGKQPKIK